MLDVGCWMLDVGCLMFDVGCWMLDVGCWMLDVGCLMFDVGCLMFVPDGVLCRTGFATPSGSAFNFLLFTFHFLLSG